MYEKDARWKASMALIIMRHKKIYLLLLSIILILLVYLILFYFGIPSAQNPSIPPFRGLIDVREINHNIDIQEVLSFKLKDSGNAADYYLQALSGFDSTIFISPPIFVSFGAKYNTNYKGIEKILEGSQYRKCDFPGDYYYAVVTTWGITDFKASHLGSAVLSKAEILFEQGKNDEALKYVEAVVVFGRHLEDSRLSLSRISEGNDITIDGLKQLVNYYKKKGMKKELSNCLVCLSDETTFARKIFTFEHTTFHDRPLFFPKIKGVPHIEIIIHNSNIIDPIMECALYHKDPCFRSTAVFILGALKSHTTNNFYGLPIHDSDKEKVIYNVIHHIIQTDPDPKVRFTAKFALSYTPEVARISLIR